MAYEIEFGEDAERHLRGLSARDRVAILDAVEEQLVHEPAVATRRRKLLRENPLAAWELRVGEYRVFYNVDGEGLIVVVIAIGVKRHNALFIDDKEFFL
jgi:mRNA-degrading endonuclease RelE of RelBE toxin-antitoxin system